MKVLFLDMGGVVNCQGTPHRQGTWFYGLTDEVADDIEKHLS